MRASARLWTTGLVLCMAAWLAWPSGGGAAVVPSVSSARATAEQGAWLNGLEVPGVQPLDGSQQLLDERRARLTSPEAVFARERSRTAYEHLSGAAAARLAREIFPVSVGRAAGPPVLPAGQQITRYVSTHAAEVSLPGAKHAVVESSAPIATPSGPGKFAPLNLGLAEAGASFVPRSPTIPVRIPKRLSAGMSLAASGVSLTPVAPDGAVLGGAPGSLDGASVIYANTQTDTDTVVKPTASGFEIDSLLRSMQSPEQLEFKVGMPAGAHLVKMGGNDRVRVIEDGATLATILVPSAEDAAGTSVPVSIRVSGGLLSVTAHHRTGDYQYPIDVDPVAIDSTVSKGHWEKECSSDFECLEVSGWLVDRSNYGETGSQGLWGYETYGESHIYEFTSETNSSGEHIENQLGIVKHPGVKEAEANYPASYSSVKTELCSESGCATGKVTSGNEANVAYFQQTGIGSGEKTFTAIMGIASVYVLQEKAPTAKFNESMPNVGAETNVLYNHSWLGPHRGAFDLEASDPGMGLDQLGWSSPSSSEWSDTLTEPCVECEYHGSKIFEPVFYYWKECSEFGCPGYTHPLPDGEDKVEVKVADAAGLSYTASATVKVDGTAPYGITLTGLPANKEIAEKNYRLKVTAKDGSGTTPSSGVESLVLKIDGNQVGTPAGSCTPGPCTATGEWTINGDEFAVGQHEVSVTATDHAGNVASEKYTMYVARPTTPLSLGPGSVDPQSGEFRLGATDASIAAPGASLSVGRSYGSLHTTAGAEGPLGPQWMLNVGSTSSLTKLPDGDMLLANGLGLQAVFTSAGGGAFTAPKGDEGLVLSEKEVSGKVQFILKSGSGSVTTFTASPSGSGSEWLPTTVEQAAGLDAVTTSYQTVGSITEPTQILAPKPVGVSSCSPELVKGCRALGFVYASKTTATGEAQSEWGEYNGRLKEITFTAWETKSGKMVTTAVADYQYDKQGRLRAEWDPRISPALKTTYGYDSSGHLTALTPPGEQPWLLTYGTIAGDARNGRLLATTRPSAETAAGNGIAPQNTTAPAVSGTLTVGSTLSVSNGSWSNTPLGYAYQWENCNSSGGECAVIDGATNPTYVLASSTAGHKIRATVTATNSDGSVAASSAVTSSTVPYPSWYFDPIASPGSGNGELSSPTGVAVDSSGDIWVVDSGNNRIEEFSGSGTFLTAYGSLGSGNGQFNKPTGIAINPSNRDIYVVDTGNDRVEQLNSGGRYVGQFGTKGSGNDEFNAPTGITVSSALGVIYVVDTGNNRVEAFNSSNNEFNKAATFGSSGTGKGQFAEPHGIAVYEESHFYYCFVTDTGNNRVQKFRVSASSSIWESTFGSSGTGNGYFAGPVGVSVSSKTDEVAVVDKGNNRVELFSSSGGYSRQFGTSGSGYYGQLSSPEWLAEQGTGETTGSLYVSDSGNGRLVQAWTQRLPDPPVSAPTPPNPGTSAVSTIEYHVPISGKAAPHALGSKEVGEWAQSDPPSEATAIFPPDEVEGWPAQNYKRATVYYLDSQGRTVNVASPSGGVTMTQYASNNEVLQTLSADNRQKALEAGSKSKEVAQSLETVNSYNSEGTELEKVEGPLHTIRLANGTQVEARHVTKYSYDEGAPSEGGPYRLVTKTVDSANVAGKEEEPRTTTAGYGGQSNLGWKLHKPTSTTTDPSGLKLTNTTVYEEGTGNVLESTGPLGNQESAPPAYAFSFGSGGTGNGQFNQPKGNAVDSSGDVWVADGYNNRIEKFSSTGTFLAAYGKYGNSKTELQFEQPIGIAINQSTGNIYVGDADNNRVDELSSSGTLIRTFGEVGSGNGQFEEAEGVAIDSKGNVWVTDYGNNRVQEFTESGTYVAQFGEKGSGNGQFSGPNAITISGGNIYVSDNNNGRVEEFNEKREFVRSIGSKGSGNGQLDYPGSIGVDSSGNIYVSDEGNSRIEEFTGSGTFLSTIGSKGSGNGQFSGPAGLTVLASGVMYVDDGGNNRVEEWVTNAGGAHTSQTIYYTTAANAKHENCGGHAEWAGLPCQTQPAKQPETGGLPGLPVTTYTYSMLDEPEIVVQTVGSKTRTETNTYDASGRVLTTSVSSSVGTALPTVTDEYDSKLGLLIKQSVESKTKSLTSVFNSLGQLTSYTDADGNTATYNYDVDGRAEKLNDGKGTQTYSYDTTTGEMTKLVDSAAGTFTATYDLEGNQTSEVLPNGMSANYTLDATGKPVNLEYVKTTYCTEEKEKCRWFKDAVVPSIHGQWLKQTSSLSGQEYTYDAAGRLTQVQDTPVGKGCTTRIYAYDADTNRTSLTTREPGSEGKCASEGGSVETHVYDPADRLIDSGVSYNEFGNTIALPGSDAGGYELTSAFYTDNQLQSQTQNGETIGYNLDPAGRTRETVSTGKIVASVIDHYVGPGEEPAWTSEVSGKWTRNIMGINGALVAVQNNGETPVLQIGNLHGDIVGTASLSETATGLASSADTTEFGVPRTGTPPKYSWVGAHELPTELPSGVIAMGARSYVPQLGRFLQTDPVPGGSADAYTYTFGDPVNSSDPTGEFAQWFKEFAANNATEIAIAAAAREKAAEEEAARKAAEAAERALGMTGDSEMSGGEEWEEWEEWEEGEGEGGYGEYVSAIHNFEGGKEGAHVGSGVFYQLRQESDGEVEVKAKAALRLCRDAAGGARKVEACARYASIFSKIGHWVHKHIIKPAEHFLDEIASNLPKCYPFEIRGGSQCSSSPPGDGGNPFYPLFPEP